MTRPTLTALLLAALAALSISCSRPEARDPLTLTGEQSKAIEALISRESSAGRFTGAAVAVLRQGRLVKSVLQGVSDLERKSPVTGSTPFQLASTTKTLSASGVLALVGDGKLSLQTRVGDVLGDLPAAWRAVTVQQLLSHTSGLPDIVRRPGQLDLIAASWPEALALVREAPMQFAPGQRWAYTQTNYVLLAMIVGHVSGMPFEQFMQQRFFIPLGMKNTFYAEPGDPRCATNYLPGTGRSFARRALDFPPYVHAAGGLCSSLDDLVRWNRALDEHKILPAALLEKMWADMTLSDGQPVRIGGSSVGYGLGWAVDETPHHRWAGHSGGNCTVYRRYLDDGLTVIVLHNGEDDPDGLASSIAAIALGGSNATSEAQERLWDAAKDGDTAAIEKALHDGAEVDALDTRKSPNGRRALNWAAAGNQPDAVRLLIKRGAMVNAANKTGFTALHHAAEKGAAEAAAALVAAGADRTLRNADGETAAAVARRKGHTGLAAQLESAH